VPIAIYGFLFFPDTPATTKAFYLSDAQKALAISRVPPVADRSPWSWTFFRRTLTSRFFWGFMILWIIAGETESFSSNALLALYLKSHPTHKYTISQLNNYPTGVPAAGIISTLFWATLTDFLNGKRYLVGYFIGITGVVTSALILAAADNPDSPRSTPVVFGAYYWAGAVYACQATFFAWANDTLRYEEHMFRAIVLAGMNLGSNVINAWWSIVFYGASMAPWFKVSQVEATISLPTETSSMRFHGKICPWISLPLLLVLVQHDQKYKLTDYVPQRGMWAMIGVSIALVIWTAGLSYMTARHERVRKAELGAGVRGDNEKQVFT
jgi:ACS family pantothenate transporter-like MFS transporter